ncbi:MAG: hypothetical protein HWE25_16540 [Alphaproteobacteria bacterium]|nr:hypothetical protein [Alphaproteobacteria bacterium]
MPIQIEGLSVQDILALPFDELAALVFIDRPIVINVGSAEVLGQFAVDQDSITVELAQIDGGGEGILPALTKISRHVGKQAGVSEIRCIVHALNCAKPNLKLRAHLIKTGFEIKEIPGKGEAYFKKIPL